MKQNIFKDIPATLPDELFERLITHPSFRLERILSRGHATPEGEWYDQDHDEWVLLLKGAAALQFEDSLESVELGPGDYLLLPAHRRHRVSWTMDGEDTVWLALHYQSIEEN